MILFFFLLNGLNVIIQAAKYDSGNKILSCGSNSIQTGTITFNIVFTNQPQVAVFSVNFDIPTSSKFSFETGNITKIKFDYKIRTLTNQINQYIFYWRAFDDKRIEVINRFDQDVSGGANKIYTIPHSNHILMEEYISIQVLLLCFTIVLGTDQSFIKDTSTTVYNIQATNPSFIYSYVQ